MAEAYYIFTDEAGAYNKRPSESFRRSHPFYIRANVRLSASDYRVFQKEIQELNTKYGVPVGEEIKWSDLWEISKGKYRVDFLKSFTPDKIKGYYRRFFNRVVDKPSLLFIFTVTCVYTQPCYQAENEVLKFHMQEAFQRIQMDTRPDGFATVIMDELNQDKVKQLKDACHRMMVEGDFVKYENVYHGVLTECSSQSAGIQLADYAVGIMNSYLRKHLMSRGDYEDFLHRHRHGRILFLELGVGGNTPGIIKVPFLRMTAQNPKATYACINLGEAITVRGLEEQSILLDADIGAVLSDLR